MSFVLDIDMKKYLLVERGSPKPFRGSEVKLRSARPLPYSRSSIVTLTLTLPLAYPLPMVARPLPLQS